MKAYVSGHQQLTVDCETPREAAARYVETYGLPEGCIVVSEQGYEEIHPDDWIFTPEHLGTLKQ